ncbi:MAG: enoyl-CoA hydratase/isomerase family protein, partial [Acidimicrobiales bacterium]
AVVVTGTGDKVFCAGANIGMLAQAAHADKVNFCKFTNETRLAIEDASACSGQVWMCALDGSASGGGYELALACEWIVLVDDRTSAVSLPEVPLLGVLPGTGGLTRLVDKRRVRRDRADVVATRAEGVRGEQALAWGLVDEVVARSGFEEAVRRRALLLAARSWRPAGAQGVELTPVERRVGEDGIDYPHVSATIDRRLRAATILVRGPGEDQPADPAAAAEAGAAWWPLAVARELDDLVLHLRVNETAVGTFVLTTAGDLDAVAAVDELLLRHGTARGWGPGRGGEAAEGTADGGAPDWFVAEVVLYWKRVLKRLDVTARSLVALIEPGSCFAGTLAELALGADRAYMLDGPREGEDGRGEAALVLTGMSFGALPMGSGLTRLESRVRGEAHLVEVAAGLCGNRIHSAKALELGLVTFTPDDLDWDDEVRLFLEERAAFSPDALSGMEASLRFCGPETTETKIFGRLSAWQNWVFSRRNAHDALERYGTGTRPAFDPERA